MRRHICQHQGQEAASCCSSQGCSQEGCRGEVSLIGSVRFEKGCIGYTLHDCVTQHYCHDLVSLYTVGQSIHQCTSSIPSSARVRIVCAVRLVKCQQMCILLMNPTSRNNTMTTVPSGVGLPRPSRVGRNVRKRPVRSGLRSKHISQWLTHCIRICLA